MDPQVLQALKVLFPQLAQEGQKATGNPFAGPYMYEGGGLFGRADGASTLINALVGPIGFERVLNWYGVDTYKEFTDAWTDIDLQGEAYRQTSVCGNCPKASMKACAQLYCLGRFCAQGDELQFDRLGLKQHSNIPIKNLFGSITAADGTVLVPMGSAITDEFYIQSALTGYNLRYLNSAMLWTGNPANNIGNSYQEYMGFQLIVNTGKFDAYTQLACSALDSFLMNMNYNVFTTDGTYSVRRWFKRMVDQFKFRANRAGLDWNAATMYIVMTENQWDCVARIYACAGVDLCSITQTENEVVVNADQAQARYEEYLSREALPIGGRWYPVVLDSQIPEVTGQANGVCSDIYFITTSLSGREVTYGQYQNMQATYGKTRAELVSMFGSDDIAITDNGRFALIRQNERGCFDLQAYTKPRIIAEMPQLLGRIQNACCGVQERPFPDPSGSGGVYEPGGGRTITPVPTVYGPCIDC